ncbi:MAG TPA: tyramine oxidase, partial [Kribbella sp.]|nr:tyramine oxidase [Kribbella sp.]
MTTIANPDLTRTTCPSHPLDRLSASELDLNRSILDAAGFVGPATRFPLVQLAEPSKADVIAWQPGQAWDRRVRSVLLERGVGTVTEVVVSLTERRVVDRRVVDLVNEGQPPIMGEEFDLVEQILWADEQWCAAMARRGLTTPERIRISALSAGQFELPGEDGRRLVRCLSFLQLDDEDNVWAHPIDGIVAYVDL